jgi:hypothetical protein
MTATPERPMAERHEWPSHLEAGRTCEAVTERGRAYPDAETAEAVVEMLHLAAEREALGSRLRVMEMFEERPMPEAVREALISLAGALEIEVTPHTSAVTICKVAEKQTAKLAAERHASEKALAGRLFESLRKLAALEAQLAAEAENASLRADRERHDRVAQIIGGWIEQAGCICKPRRSWNPGAADAGFKIRHESFCPRSLAEALNEPEPGGEPKPRATPSIYRFTRSSAARRLSPVRCGAKTAVDRRPAGRRTAFRSVTSAAGNSKSPPQRPGAAKQPERRSRRGWRRCETSMATNESFSTPSPPAFGQENSDERDNN